MAGDRDDELMVALARGEESALRELIARHQDRVWRVAAGVLGDHHLARDVAQQVFLKLLDAAPTYRPEGRLRAWLRTVTTRLCLGEMRRRLPEPRAEVEVPGEPRRDDPAWEVEDAARREALRAAILDLPIRQRVAVVLRYDEGLGYDAIAEALGEGATRKTVERLLGRARARLAEVLG